MKPRLELHLSIAQQYRFLFGKPYQPGESEYLFNHSRCGIFLAIKSLDLPYGARVGVMVYNCHTVMNAVKQAGCRPLFLDVTDEMRLDMEDLRLKVDKMSAIIVTHLFGIVSDVKKIREAYPNLVIIEDCAHAFGMKDFYGDFATFSIGQGKLPSIGDGGILKVLNAKYAKAIDALYHDLPEYSGLQNARLLMKMIASSLLHSRIVYSWLTLPIKQKRGDPKDKEMLIPMRMSRGIRAVFLKERDVVSRMIALRKSKAELLMSNLPKGVLKAMVGQNAFMLVLYCNNPAVLQKYYRRQGVDTATHFKYAIHWAMEFGYSPKQCPNAEKLANKLLMVPVYN